MITYQINGIISAMAIVSDRWVNSSVELKLPHSLALYLLDKNERTG
jgi:hypothetical protein